MIGTDDKWESKESLQTVWLGDDDDIYIYIYIYIERERERENQSAKTNGLV